MICSVACSDLQDQIQRHLSGQLSREDFEDAFIGFLQDYLDSGDSSCIALANEVNALLVESVEKAMNETDFKSALYLALCPTGQTLILETLASTSETFVIGDAYAAPTITIRANFAAAGT